MMRLDHLSLAQQIILEQCRLRHDEEPVWYSELHYLAGKTIEFRPPSADVDVQVWAQQEIQPLLESGLLAAAYHKQGVVLSVRITKKGMNFWSTRRDKFVEKRGLTV